MKDARAAHHVPARASRLCANAAWGATGHLGDAPFAASRVRANAA